jgi:hypothetical protein
MYPFMKYAIQYRVMDSSPRMNQGYRHTRVITLEWSKRKTRRCLQARGHRPLGHIFSFNEYPDVTRQYENNGSFYLMGAKTKIVDGNASNDDIVDV